MEGIHADVYAELAFQTVAEEKIGFPTENYNYQTDEYTGKHSIDPP